MSIDLHNKQTKSKKFTSADISSKQGIKSANSNDVRIGMRLTITNLNKPKFTAPKAKSFGPKWSSKRERKVERTANKPFTIKEIGIAPKNRDGSMISIHNSDIFKNNPLSKPQIMQLSKDLVHKIDHNYDHLKDIIKVNRIMDKAIWDENLITIFDCAKTFKKIWLSN